MFFSCGCSRHHHHPPPHVLELLNRCTARQMWLNLAVCILSPCLFFFFFSPCSWAIRGARVGKQAHSHYVVFVNVCECVPRWCALRQKGEKLFSLPTATGMDQSNWTVWFTLGQSKALCAYDCVCVSVCVCYVCILCFPDLVAKHFHTAHIHFTTHTHTYIQYALNIIFSLLHLCWIKHGSKSVSKSCSVQREQNGRFLL